MESPADSDSPASSQLSREFGKAKVLSLFRVHDHNLPANPPKRLKVHFAMPTFFFAPPRPTHSESPSPFSSVSTFSRSTEDLVPRFARPAKHTATLRHFFESTVDVDTEADRADKLFTSVAVVRFS